MNTPMDPIYESIAKEIAGFLEPLPCPVLR